MIFEFYVVVSFSRQKVSLENLPVFQSVA